MTRNVRHLINYLNKKGDCVWTGLMHIKDRLTVGEKYATVPQIDGKLIVVERYSVWSEAKVGHQRHLEAMRTSVKNCDEEKKSTLVRIREHVEDSVAKSKTSDELTIQEPDGCQMCLSTDKDLIYTEEKLWLCRDCLPKRIAQLWFVKKRIKRLERFKRSLLEAK